MAKITTPDDLLKLLATVKFPGFEENIVELGIVEQVSPAENSTFLINLRQATRDEETKQELAASIVRVLQQNRGFKAEIRFVPVQAELGEKTGLVRLEAARFIVAVASGKGGVGKSTVAANLALALVSAGFATGLLDADIYGPSVPMMFGTGAERPQSAGGQRFYPLEQYGLKLVSIGFFLGEKAPVIWRGPMVMSAVRQFLNDALWGSLDFLIVDLPPGTGDAQLTLAQQVYLDGAVIVTTPQDVALLDAQRALRMFRQVHCPVLGVVENMSYFVCPDCGERDELFGSGGGERLAREEGVEVLAKLPICSEVRLAGDRGMPIFLANPQHPASVSFKALAQRVVSLMPK